MNGIGLVRGLMILLFSALLMNTATAVTFPAGTVVIPMDGKQADYQHAYGFVHAILRNGSNIERIIEPPDDVQLSVDDATYNNTIFYGGPIFIRNITAVQSITGFSGVTYFELTSPYTVDDSRVFSINKPTKILIIYQSRTAYHYAHSEKILDNMSIPYDMKSTNEVDSDPSIVNLSKYNLIVVDCAGWVNRWGASIPPPAAVTNNMRTFVQNGGEIIFNDIALVNLAQVFGTLSIGNSEVNSFGYGGTITGRVYNPPIDRNGDVLSPAYLSQYNGSTIVPIRIHGNGKTIKSIAYDNVTVLMNSSDYNSGTFTPKGGANRAITAYFRYGNGTVEAFEPHPDEQTSPEAVRMLFTLIGNKFIHTEHPDISITKSVDKAQARAGDELRYEIHYNNINNVNLTGVILTDTIPANTAVVPGSISDAGYVSGNTIIWNIGSLNVSETGTQWFNVTINSNTPNATIILNTATINSTQIGPKSAQATTRIEMEPEINITKTVDKSQAKPGDVLSYTINYSNADNVNLTEVILTDTIPANTTLVPGSISDAGSVSGNIITWNIGTLNIGESGTQGFDVTVNSSIANNTIVLNTATINSTQVGPKSAQATTIVFVPAIDITKSVDKTQAKPNDVLRYTINYNNADNVNLTGVVLTDTIPANTTLVPGSISDAGSVSGNTITWNIGTLNIGESGTQWFNVTVNSNIANNTIVLNTATINSTQAGPKSAQATTIVFVPAIDITKSVDKTQAKPNDVLRYTINYNNADNVDLTGVVLTDTIPANTTLVPGSISDAGYVSGNTITWNIGTLNIGESGTQWFNVTVNSNIANNTIVLNTATINSTQAGPKSAQATTIVFVPAIEITKSVDKSKATWGDVLRYTITYRNADNINLTEVVLTDTIPANTALVPGSISDAGSVSGNKITWNIGTLNIGESGTQWFNVTVNSSAARGAVILNTATINSTQAGPKSAQATTTVIIPDISISKVVDKAQAKPGDVLLYTISYSNSGDVNLTGVVLTDEIPENTALVPGSISDAGSVSGDTITWNIGTLNIGESGTQGFGVTIGSSVPSRTEILNIATIDSTQVGPESSEATTLVITAGRRCPPKR